MEEQQPIVTLTLNPALDMSFAVNRVVPEWKLRCEDVRREPGGGGINVAHAIGNLGGRAVAVWTCGGKTGERMASLLDASSIDHRPVSLEEGETRESIHAFDRSTGQQYRFVLPGPGLSDADVDRCLAMIGELLQVPGYLVVSGSMPPGVRGDLYGRVCAATPPETRVIVDTSGASLAAALEAGVFLVKPNLAELSQVAERELGDDEAITTAARELIAAGKTEAVIVSLGSGGALAVWSDSTETVRSPTVPIRSKVGAGDSMVAGMALHLARGCDLREAVKFGVAAGAAAVMTEGTELCRREDAERLYASMRTLVPA